MKYIFAANNGGHLTEALEVMRLLAIKFDECLIITEYGEHLKYRNYFFVSPFLGNPIKTTSAAIKLFFKILMYRPNVVITTGAEVGVIVSYISKILWNPKLIFIETFNRKITHTESLKMLHRIADEIIVQSKFNNEYNYLGELI